MNSDLHTEHETANYEHPMLSFIGSMGNLTTGGSGSKRESKSGGGDGDDDGGDDESRLHDSEMRYAGILFPKANAASNSPKKRP